MYNQPRFLKHTPYGYTVSKEVKNNVTREVNRRFFWALDFPGISRAKGYQGPLLPDKSA
jgi:hypothetical protein